MSESEPKPQPIDDGEADIRGVKLITDAEGNWRVVIEPIE